MESEIVRLESINKEQDEQLSSFKSVLDEKETILHKQQEKESQLSERLCVLDQLCQSKDCQIENLDSELARNSQDVVELKEKVHSLEASLDEITFHGKELEGAISEKNSRLSQLESEIEDTRVAQAKVEQELANKTNVVSSLSHFVETQKKLIEEKEEEILRRVGEIEVLENSVQSSNDSLRETVEGSEEAAKMLESNSRKLQDLEQQVLVLRNELESERANVDQARVASRELEKELVIARGSVKEMETLRKKADDLNVSLSSHQEKTEFETTSLEHKLQNLHEHLQVSVAEKDHVVSELDDAKQSFADKERTVKKLESERDDLSTRCSELQSKATKLSGALEFAQQELSGKESTIRNLSETLEQKKIAVTTMTRDLAQAKAECAEKLQESLQHSEKGVQAKVLLEETKGKLEKRETELKQAREEMEAACKERSAISTELEIAMAKLEALEREGEVSKVESETLRGKVEYLSSTGASLKQDQSKHMNELADLNSKLIQSSDQVKELQSKVQSTRKRLSNVTAERDDVVRKGKEVEAELARNVKENQQMKQQFDSAVKLMDSKLSDQASAMHRLTEQLHLKESTITSLTEQLTSDSRKSSELMEKIVKVSADYKISSDRCRLLEKEKVELRGRLSELMTQNSHLQYTYNETLTEREAIRCEHEASLKGMQGQEMRVLTLTEQLAQVAREKYAVEDKLREMSKQLLSSEQKKSGISAELEELRGKVHKAQSLDREKLVSFGQIRNADIKTWQV